MLLGTSIFLGILTLWTKQLLSLYRFMASVIIMFYSHKVSRYALNGDLETASIFENLLQLNFSQSSKHFQIIFYYLVQQLVLAKCFWEAQEVVKDNSVKNFIVSSFVIPVVLAGLPIPAALREYAAVYASLVPFLFLFAITYLSFGTIMDVIHERFHYGKRMVQNFGWNTFIETEWHRLDVPNLFRSFWVLRMLINTYLFTRAHYTELSSNPNGMFTPLLESVLATGCDTNLAVLGMSSVYSYVSGKICSFFQSVLLVTEEEDSFGTISAILFVLLAMQNGLTTLPPKKRIVRLFRNSCLLLTCMLHFIHSTLNPVLMSLCTSRNPSFQRHARSWMVCLFLIIFPAYMIYVLHISHQFSTWIFAVTAFSVEVIIKVLISLTIYSLFLIDARHDDYWEDLDDYVYWVKSTGNAIEFIFGILLFLNGAFIMIFESGGCIRAAMICIHAYFNIWCEARSGWKVFVRRKTAVDKIASLPEASSEELQRRGDACAICFNDMETAKITRCRHYFHGVCLRKWLYVQDKCPLCHETLSADNKNNRADIPRSEIQPQPRNAQAENAGE
ncbi:hypothetical protein QYM36_015935 [Artemia franciscana]|uniref:RING-type domain-containing protein n=1 Tax=Artemia franciscana TaxID=6661 RepID=A0AA88HHI9_ARTSF|nr:hypothetical protein QYM36_015935 [Artemia franciscana]